MMPTKLRITRQWRPVLVRQTWAGREFVWRRFWVVLMVMPDGSEQLAYAGRDDTIWGHTDCVDWARSIVKRARANS